MSKLSIVGLVQQDEAKRPQKKPCVFCVDYTKGSLSDRACSECNPPLYKKFVMTGRFKMNDYPLFSERLAIAERADEIIKKHHIKKDTFGVVCALALIGALKTPNEPETCKWNRVDPSAIVNPHTGLIHDDFQKFCEVCGKRIEAVK